MLGLRYEYDILRFRYRTNINFDRDRMPQGGLEERGFQFRRYADASRVSGTSRRKVQQEDRGDREETSENEGYREWGWASYSVPVLQEQASRNWSDLW